MEAVVHKAKSSQRKRERIVWQGADARARKRPDVAVDARE